MKTLLLALFSAILLISVSCCEPGSGTAATTDSTATADNAVVDEAATKATVDHHLKSFGEGNLDEIMKDYTEESIVVAQDKTHKGNAEIRGDV